MLQHQMVHSPARLGLANPNSPSLNQQSQQQQQPPPAPSGTAAAATSTSASSKLLPNSSPSPSSSSAAATTTAASNALLSLLPPLGRAQSLLAQMASLASRLFEVSPNRSVWLASFRGTLPTFLSSSTVAAAPSPSSAASAKEILSHFTSLQTQLFEAVAQLQEILDLQDSAAKLSRDVRSRDAAALSFARRLADSERLLDSLLDDYSSYRKRPKPNPNGDEDDEEEDEEDEDDEDMDEATSSGTTTVASRLRLPDILSYAHRISYTTFAPPEFGAGQAPLRGAMPPAPQEEQMRASQLYTMAGLDVGLPPTDARGFEPMMEPPPPAPAAAVSDFGLLPPNITVPEGWKPGMPIELPINLPLPPPGWKPGDPVPLPPMPSLREPPRPKPASETIQVRHVQLDILDQDDDSSDYSSDDASSDDSG